MAAAEAHTSVLEGDAHAGWGLDGDKALIAVEDESVFAGVAELSVEGRGAVLAANCEAIKGREAGAVVGGGGLELGEEAGAVDGGEAIGALVAYNLTSERITALAQVDVVVDEYRYFVRDLLALT